MGSNGIKHVRVDERLIHGQVATMWTNTIKATRIMIVDDAVVKMKWKSCLKNRSTGWCQTKYSDSKRCSK